MEEAFVEIDHLLISKQGHDILTQYELEEKNLNSKTMLTSLNPVEDYQVKQIPLTSGCTACVVLLTPDKIFCANAGDSRGILAFKEKSEIIELSTDHKPKNE